MVLGKLLKGGSLVLAGALVGGLLSYNSKKTEIVAGINDILPNRDLKLDIYPKEREMVVVNNDLTVERWQQ